MAHKKKAHMKKQSSKSKLDESLSAKHGKESDKKQSFKARRDESKGSRGMRGC